MRITTIASGSSGNCYLLTDECNNTLILECGKGTFENALKAIPDVSKISGGLISHFHLDHCQDKELWESYGINFLTPEQFQHAQQINIGKGLEWSVISLAVEHDPTIECYAFFIRSNVEEKYIFFATDCYNYSRIIDALPEPLSLCLCEVNHDMHMLDTCKYPAHLKERIRKTHCSVQRASLAIGRAKCQKFLLVHPSETTIDQEAALKHFRDEFPNRSFEFARPGLTMEV